MRRTGKNDTDYSKQLEVIKKQGSNKSCFDCGEKGTTYVVMNFGTFVCSRCAGILRELNFKVKGTGVTIFSEKDIELIKKNGNDKARTIWMGKFKSKHDRLPDPKKYDDVKQHIIDKYKNKRYYVEEGKESDDEEDKDNDSDDSEEKKKPKKSQINKEKNNNNSSSGNTININKGKLSNFRVKGNSTQDNKNGFEFPNNENTNTAPQFEFPTENNSNSNSDWGSIWGASNTNTTQPKPQTQPVSNNPFDFPTQPVQNTPTNPPVSNNPFDFTNPPVQNSPSNPPVSNNPFDFTNLSSTPVQPVNQPQNTNPMFDFNHPPQQTQPNTTMFNPVNEQPKPMMPPQNQQKPAKNYADLEQALNDPSILGQNKQPQPTTSMPSQIPQTNPMMNNNPMMNQAAFINNMKQMMQGNPQMMQMMNNPNMQNMMYQMMMNYMNMMNTNNMNTMPMNPPMGNTMPMTAPMNNMTNPNPIPSMNQPMMTPPTTTAQPPKEEEKFDAFKDIYNFSQTQLKTAPKKENTINENPIPQTTIPQQIPSSQPPTQSNNPFDDNMFGSSNNVFQQEVKQPEIPKTNNISINQPMNNNSTIPPQINNHAQPKNINQGGEYNPFDFL